MYRDQMLCIEKLVLKSKKLENKLKKDRTFLDKIQSAVKNLTIFLTALFLYCILIFVNLKNIDILIL